MNKKMVVIIILILLFIRPIYRLLQRIQINYYFMMNYDSNEYEIVEKIYYESGNLSGRTDILEEYGISFPSYVYEIQEKSSTEKIPGLEVTRDHFYLGTNCFTIWDTYKIDVEGIVNTQRQLNYKFNLWVNDILAEMDGVKYVSVKANIDLEDEVVNNLNTSKPSFVENVNVQYAYKYLNLYVNYEEISREKVIEIVQESNRLLEENGIYINEFYLSLHIEYKKVAQYQFEHKDIKNGNLLLLMEQADDK